MLPFCGRPKTRAEQSWLKQKGDIRGWVSLPRGRPPKRKPDAAPEVIDEERPGLIVGSSSTNKKRGKRGSYHKWCIGEGQNIISAHITNRESSTIPIPRATIYSAKKRLSKQGSVITDGRVEKGLTSKEDQHEIAEILRCRDMNNNGMSRSEAITLLMDWTGCTDRSKAKNHFAYLVQNKIFPDLKRDGRVVTAQKSTTKRGQITIEQQVRWHGVIESIWKDQDATNLPAEKFHPLKPHFMCNVDETCVMGSEGTLKIIGDGKRKKHNKSVEDNRGSITVV